jgi:aspartate racemase
MSWESTALYYQLLNEGIRDRLGGLHSARCVIHSVDFAEIERLQQEDRWDKAGELLAACANGLQAAGADVLLICTNTMHIVADEIQAAIDIPLLHLADATATAVKQAGVACIGLLGTAFTMEKAFYKDRLASHDIDVIVPDLDDRQLVHHVIYDELCLGVVKDSSRAEYRRIIEKLVASGAQGIVAGCTEIELLVNETDCPVPLFPTTRLHVDAAIAFALGRTPN